MTTPRTLTPEIAPDIRPAAGHALLTERRRGKTRVRCECGEQFGRGSPATSLDSTGRAWAQHMARESR